MAEVLITLGVVGVIAAMTIPTVVSNYQKMVTVHRLKQTYSQIWQAMRMVSNDFGGDDPDGWDCSDWDIGANWYKSPAQSRCIYLVFDKIANATIFPRTGKKETMMCHIPGKDYPEYTYVNGVKVANNDKTFCGNGYSASFPNGACVAWTPLYWCYESGGSFIIDVNGSYTGPNRMGRDLFVFRWGTANDQVNPVPALALWPHGYTMTRNGVITVPERKQLINSWRGCNKYQEGANCTGLLVHDGWKISPDYPW